MQTKGNHMYRLGTAVVLGMVLFWGSVRAPAAEPLRLTEVSEPMRSTTRSGTLMYAFDRRHEHVHLIQWYFRAYQGPTHGIAINTGTGETRRLTIPDNLQIHMAATEMAEDGRLYIITPWWYQAERKGTATSIRCPA